MMKKTFSRIGVPLLLLAILQCSGLQAQNPNAIISDFTVFSYLNGDVIADSVEYHPENPELGPVGLLEDTLTVYSPGGGFNLNYLPVDQNAFLGIWVDLDEDGRYEEDERIYSGQAMGGNLSDGFEFPFFTGPRSTLVAISQNQTDFNDPREITGNSQISSLEFIMISAPPTLTMGSKKDTNGTRAELERYCDSIDMQLILPTGFPCMEVYKWIVQYPVNNDAQVNSNITPDFPTDPLTSGNQYSGYKYIPFTFNFSSFSINTGDTVNLIFSYYTCDDPPEYGEVNFEFIRDCDVRVADPQNQWNDQLKLEVFPNPIKRQARFTYELEEAGPVQLAIFDYSGRQLEVLQDGLQPAGSHRLDFQTRDLPAGMYWLRLRTRNGFSSRKLIIQRE